MNLIPYSEHTGQLNMQIDSDLLDSAIIKQTSSTTFRLYGWNPKCISLGRNQKDSFLDDTDNIDVKECYEILEKVLSDPKLSKNSNVVKNLVQFVCVHNEYDASLVLSILDKDVLLSNPGISRYFRNNLDANVCSTEKIESQQELFAKLELIINTLVHEDFLESDAVQEAGHIIRQTKIREQNPLWVEYYKALEYLPFTSVRKKLRNTIGLADTPERVSVLLEGWETLMRSLNMRKFYQLYNVIKSTKNSEEAKILKLKEIIYS